MEKVKNKLVELINNTKRVVKLAYEIDKHLLILYYVTSAIGAVTPIVCAYLFKLTIDKIIQTSALTTPETIIPLVVIFSLAGYFVINLVENISYWGLNANYYDYLLRNKLQSGLTYRYADKLASLDLQHLEDPEIQNLITKVEQTYAWQIPDFIRIWNYVLRDIVGIIAILVAFSQYSFWIPLVVLIIASPRIFFKLRYGNFVWSMFGGNAPDVKKLWYTSDLLTKKPSIMETRIFQSQKALLERLQELLNHLYEVNKKPIDGYKWVVIIAPIVESLTVFGIVYYFLPNALSGALSIGSLTFIITTLQQLRDHTTWGSSHLGEIYEKSLFVNPYFELMALPKIVKNDPNPKVFKKIEPPKIEFKKVSFSYSNGREVLKDISFVVNPGESVALVGVNGAGKSTIIKLLCRFYDVSSGEILVNGINVKKIKLSKLAKFQ